jgi:hypothetical protein
MTPRRRQEPGISAKGKSQTLAATPKIGHPIVNLQSDAGSRAVDALLNPGASDTRTPETAVSGASPPGSTESLRGLSPKDIAEMMDLVENSTTPVSCSYTSHYHYEWYEDTPSGTMRRRIVIDPHEYQCPNLLPAVPGSRCVLDGSLRCGVRDSVADIVDPGGSIGKGGEGGDVIDHAPDKVLPPPPVKKRKWVFPELTILGKLKPAPGPSIPPTYKAKSIRFEKTWDYSGKTPVKFADRDYIADINHVVTIMKGDPQLHVTIEAFVGYTWGGKYFKPMGRGEKVYKLVGGVMDARAKAVQDVMVKAGIPVERIHLSKGAAEEGEAGRRVDFHFTRE